MNVAILGFGVVGSGVAEVITQNADPDANIIWGVGFDDELEDEMQITIIATGFEKKADDNKRKVVIKREEVAEERKPAVAVKTETAPKTGKIDDDDFLKLMTDMFGNK